MTSVYAHLRWKAADSLLHETSADSRPKTAWSVYSMVAFQPICRAKGGCVWWTKNMYVGNFALTR